VAELLALQNEFRARLDSLPKNLQASAIADKLQVICDLDLSNIESVELPRGFRTPLMPLGK
jgi:hypothetical protein